MSKLYFYHSVMNAGKSAHIIMQVHNLREQGNSVMVLKPRLDTRDLGVIKSRALKTEIVAKMINHGRIEGDNLQIYPYVYVEQPDYVFVDEVNFLTSNDIDSLAKVVDNLAIPVFGYGLLVDYKSIQFEGSKRMIELSDTIRELKTPCVKCGRKATMHLRKINDKYVFHGESIQVGDTDMYDSVCRSCYMIAKISH